MDDIERLIAEALGMSAGAPWEAQGPEGPWRKGEALKGADERTEGLVLDHVDEEARVVYLEGKLVNEGA